MAASDNHGGRHNEKSCPQGNGQEFKSPSSPPQEEGPTGKGKI